MGSLNVNMPDELRTYVDERTKAGGFGTPTEYVRHLIRKDREEATQRIIAEELARGLDSRLATGDAKALFRRLHDRVDRIEQARKRSAPRRSAKMARSKTGRRS